MNEPLFDCPYCGRRRFDNTAGECRSCGHGDSSGLLTALFLAGIVFLAAVTIFAVWP